MSDLAARVILRPRKARPFFAGHPWVFAGSIDRVEGSADAGAVVDVLSHERQFIAKGLYNPSSAIRARLYRWDAGPLDAAFWRGKLDAAIRLRTEILRLDATDAAYRLVCSEGDGLSGLTVDRYGQHLVAQVTSRALLEHRDAWAGTLLELSGAESLAFRGDRSTARQEGLEGLEIPTMGAPSDGPITIIENGLSFEVNPTVGQKTGWFLDQCENRRAVAGYARDRRVLDLYCYTGGFALNAAGPGGAREVLAVDSSVKAVEAARRNAELNTIGNATFESADAFQTLATLAERGERFGLVIVDPPKFAAKADALDEALRGYLRLNRAALAVLEPGGILVTCSCSGLVDRTTFHDVLARAGEHSGRMLQILESRGPSADHPVAAACPESDYLKCVIVRAS